MPVKISNRDLSKIVAKLFVRTRNEGDDVLHTLLCNAYPTSEAQNA